MLVRSVLFTSVALVAIPVAHSASTAPSAPTVTTTSTSTKTATKPDAKADAELGCAGVRDVDRCVAGQWEMTVDGASEYLRTQMRGASIKMTSHVGERFVLNGDGTFATGVVKTDMKMTAKDVNATGTFVSQSSGRWSTVLGKLNFCSTVNKVQGATTMVVGGRKISVPVPEPKGPAVSTQDYTCSATELVTTMKVKGGTMVSKFKRLP